jgi:hypothetical protein
MPYLDCVRHIESGGRGVEFPNRNKQIKGEKEKTQKEQG